MEENVRTSSRFVQYGMRFPLAHGQFHPSSWSHMIPSDRFWPVQAHEETWGNPVYINWHWGQHAEENGGNDWKCLACLNSNSLPIRFLFPWPPVTNAKDRFLDATSLTDPTARRRPWLNRHAAGQRCAVLWQLISNWKVLRTCPVLGLRMVTHLTFWCAACPLRLAIMHSCMPPEQLTLFSKKQHASLRINIGRSRILEPGEVCLNYPRRSGS